MAIDDVVADMQALRSNPAYRDVRIVLAGDFNTSLEAAGGTATRELESG